MNAAEDGRQGDDDDGAVELGHEDGGRRVGQGHPLVAGVRRLRRPIDRLASDVLGADRHQMLWARRSISGATACS